MRRLLAGASLGLAGFVLALTPMSGAGAADLTVAVPADCGGPEFCFRPSTLTIIDGEAVTWSNTSGADHIVARCDPVNCSGASGGSGSDAGFESGDLPAGATFSHTFHGAGSYSYYCPIHGYAAMHGAVVVNAAPTPSTSPAVAPSTTALTVTTAPAPGSTPGSTAGSTPVSGAATASASAPDPALADTGDATGSMVAVGIGAVVLGLAAWGVCTRRGGVVPRLWR